MLRKSILLFSISLLLCALSACQTINVDAVKNTPAAQTRTPTTPGTREPHATATSTPVVCTETSGTIEEVKIPTDRLSSPMIVTVYLPPCYKANSSEKYPTLYMLHGQAAPSDQWIQIGLTAAADQLITEKKIQPMIIVMPFEESWRSGPETSEFGNVLLQDVIPFIDKQYRTYSTRSGRAIGGLSRGGNWAVYLGFSHPEIFTAMGAHSAPLFYGEYSRIERETGAAQSLAEFPSIYIDMGKKDEQKDKILEFVDFLKELGFAYEFHQNEGRHENAYWSAHVSEYLQWYSSQLTQNSAVDESP